MDWLDAFNEIRARSGMSLDELSSKSGVPKGTLSKITAGITKNPSIETMKTLVHAMGYTLDDLDKKRKAPTVSGERRNIIKIVGRDGSVVIKELTDAEVTAYKTMVDHLPEADDL